jgi:hypothetical protein
VNYRFLLATPLAAMAEIFGLVSEVVIQVLVALSRFLGVTVTLSLGVPSSFHLVRAPVQLAEMLLFSRRMLVQLE